MPIIARVIEIHGPKAVLIAGETQHEVTWPDGNMPPLGSVFDVVFDPAFKIIRHLATPDDGGWRGNAGDSMRWRLPNAKGQTRMEALRLRHDIKRSVRNYLHDEGFLEIDMPLLVVGSTPDAEIESYRVEDRYLVTSTEYQIKRMEIGGFDKTYTLTQNYRNGDTGRFRNQEFTMLEWARVGETLADIEYDMEQMLYRAHLALGGEGTLTWQGHQIDITPPFDRITVRGAVKKHTGYDMKDFSVEEIRNAVVAAKLTINPGLENDRAFLFTILMDHIQTFLGFEKPIFLQEWPAFQTSSANESIAGKVTERSELFIAGVELSDGFPSLTSSTRQVQTFETQNQFRDHDGKRGVDTDQKYIDAMREGFPSGAGMALGFDRLVMILTDRPDLKSVLAYNWDEL